MKPSSYQKKIEGFRDYLKSRQQTIQSIQSGARQIKAFLEWTDKEQLEVEQVSYQDLLLYMKHCQRKDLTQRTIQNYIGHISNFYDYLIEVNRVVVNPASAIEVQGVKRKVLYHILETTALHQLYNQYPTVTMKDKRNRVMLGLLAYQGLKTEELKKLEVKDVKLREGKIEVPGGRKSDGRTLKLEPHQVMDIYDYALQIRPQFMEMKPKRHYQLKEATENLFIGEGGTHSSFSNFMTQLMLQVRKINSQVINAKQIRASVITKWLKMYNLREVQYRAGHRYISTTESYKVNDLEGLQEQVNQFHPLG
jgi:site-specific recombinase XerD